MFGLGLGLNSYLILSLKNNGSGPIVPSEAILSRSGEPILDRSGNFILERT